MADMTELKNIVRLGTVQSVNASKTDSPCEVQGQRRYHFR